MRVIEEKIIGKKSQEKCEDGIVVNDDFVAVIDGSTSKTPLRINDGMTNGRFCMEKVCSLLNDIPCDTTMEEFCAMSTDMIFRIYMDKGLDISLLKADPIQRMTASAVVFSRSLQEVWMIGDCHCIVDGKYYDNPKPYEIPIAKKRAEILKDALANGATVEELRRNDIGRESVLPILKEACKEQNKAYSVIDGFPIPLQHVRVIKVKAPETEIVLASDGYPRLMPTLRESEKEQERLLAEDPLCIGDNIATKGLKVGQKSFDDRSYIRLTS